VVIIGECPPSGQTCALLFYELRIERLIGPTTLNTTSPPSHPRPIACSSLIEDILTLVGRLLYPYASRLKGSWFERPIGRQYQKGILTEPLTPQPLSCFRDSSGLHTAASSTLDLLQTNLVVPLTAVGLCERVLFFVVVLILSSLER
jgi:hypothetical protein